MIFLCVSFGTTPMTFTPPKRYTSELYTKATSTAPDSACLHTLPTEVCRFTLPSSGVPSNVPPLPVMSLPVLPDGSV